MMPDETDQNSLGGGSKKKVWTILSIIAVLIVVVVMAYYFLNKQSASTDNTAVQQQSDSQNSQSGELAFDKTGATSDPFHDPHGPFYHRVYKAISDDGLNFVRDDEVMIDKASVPDAVKTDDGTIFVYAVDGADRSNSGIMVAVSRDDGESWEMGSVQLKNDRNGIGGADPQATLTDDGKIRLYYVVMPKKQPPLDFTGKPIYDPNAEPTKIYSAISSDGINFVEEDGVRYSSIALITDPDIIKIGDKWYMYVAQGQEEIATVSDDGETFKLSKTIRTNGAVSKTVSIGNGQFRQFYCGRGISSAVSSDGLNWTDEEGSRLTANQGEIVCDPSPVKLDSGKWIMFFKSGNTN